MTSTRSSQSAPAAHGSTCRVCGKSILNEASIKRHERYCRKRLTCPAPPRRKSCIACIRAKSRCDSYTPACGPCQRKGRSCIYSSESLVSREERPALSPAQLNHEQQLPNPPTPVPIAHQELSQIKSLNPGMFITFEASPLSVGPELLSTISSEPHGVNSVEYEEVTNDPLRESHLPSTAGSSKILCASSLHLLRYRERQPATANLVGRLVSQIICSYPERRMNEDSCPPFIHHSAFRRSTKTMISENPIVICQDITRQFAGRKAHVDLSIWNAIASEQERIYDQRGSFDKWLHLSSAQSITVYLLMLAAEGQSVLAHHPNLPITLLFTLGSLFGQLNHIHPSFTSVREGSRDTPTWEDWIFAESKLRTAAIYFILALHFELDFGIPCDREGDYKFEDVDLPAAKILWEARNELLWQKELERMEQARDSLVTICASEDGLKYGDLKRYNKQSCGHDSSAIQIDETRLAERIAKWQKEMDEFGILVALCGTMV